MRTATGQDSTAGLERIQGTFTSWTVCLRDRSESRELLALGRFSWLAWRLSTAAHSYFLDCLFEGPVSVNRVIARFSFPLFIWRSSCILEVTRAAHLLDCLSVGLVSRDFIGKNWSLSRGKFWAEAWCVVPGGRPTSYTGAWSASRLVSQSGLCLILEVRDKIIFIFEAFFIYLVEICFILKHSSFIKWKCPTRHLLLVSN